MEAFEKAAKQTKEEREKLLSVKDDMIKEHLKEAEAAKKRQLAAFDKIAQKGGGTFLGFRMSNQTRKCLQLIFLGFSVFHQTRNCC